MNAFSADAEVNSDLSERPHVVLLGAGASVATCPKGDSMGKQLPIMASLVDTLALGDLIPSHLKHLSNNFEELYSNLVEGKNPVIADLENRVRGYFASLQLPDVPTIYDYLVAGLRPKDMIGTFNWDPLLFQALKRNAILQTARFGKERLPRAVFLHGNVAVGYCTQAGSIGPVGCKSSISHQQFTPSPLLYPVKQKDYTSDIFISQMWKEFRLAFPRAFIFTVFGYSAPSTDVEAVALLKEAWGNTKNRMFEEIEIIDIEDKDVIYHKWKSFIHQYHYTYCANFMDSFIFRHPRRSVEANWARLINAQFAVGNPFPNCGSFDQLYNFLSPQFTAEESQGK